MFHVGLVKLLTIGRLWTSGHVSCNLDVTFMLLNMTKRMINPTVLVENSIEKDFREVFFTFLGGIGKCNLNLVALNINRYHWYLKRDDKHILSLNILAMSFKDYVF